MHDEAHNWTEALIKEAEEEVNKVYQQAVREMQQKLDDYLRKFRMKDEIKRGQLARGEITRQEYNYWRTGQIAIGQRWEEMRDTLAQDLHNSNKIARSIVDGYMPEAYALNHNYATFQIEKASMLDTSYTLYDRQTVERIIRDQPDLLPPPGADMKRRIAEGKDIAWQRGQIQSVMTQSILQGESIPQVARRIAQTMGESNRAATTRYARTAMTGAQNAGRVDAYERAADMGIDLEQEWLATMDSRTRYSHIDMDGESVPVGETFSNGCRFPGDPNGPPEEVWNCRCTLVPKVKGIDQSDAPRNSKLGDMTYEEWKETHGGRDSEFEAEVPGIQGEIGRAKTVDEINDIMNDKGWFSTRYQADLTGCDLESAKAIASSHQQIYEKYPQLIGKFDAPNAHPIGMGNNTYAWCYIRNGGQVQVNPGYFSDWQKLVKGYERDVLSGWHPFGTTAESIVVHEMGHAVDGLLANSRVLGGYTSSGEFRYASSSLKQTVMNRVLKDDDIAMQLVDFWGRKQGTSQYINEYVSQYAGKNAQEWFAECFAEYITSANPRPMATEFGKALEELLRRLT